MRFCSLCGAPVELQRPAGDTYDRHVCQACGEIHYRNPKVVVGAVCCWQDRVLLCRRAIEPRTGFWAVPAGYLELGESTEQGAIRETWEEACARIEISGLLAIYNVVRIGQVQLFYRARLLSPEIAAGIETLELDLFEWSRIPWQELAFPSVDYVLRRALELRGQEGPHPPALGP
jgi:ADP-ribose pyrophosphatase YjhB (NUDIX family)